jgi:VHL beta domain
MNEENTRPDGQRQNSLSSQSKDENQLSPNLFTVLWGVLALFGVLVSLLIPRADQNYSAYRATVSDLDHERALTFTQVVRWTPLFVLIGVIAFVLPVVLMNRSRGRLPSGTALVAISLVAQAAFVVGVWLLIPAVPERIPIARSFPCSQEEILSSQSSVDETRIRFVNQSSTAVRIYWLDYQGRRQLIHDLGPGQEEVQQTWQTHPFVLTSTQNPQCVQIVRAGAEPVMVPIGGES